LERLHSMGEKASLIGEIGKAEKGEDSIEFA
jgi:hypothetical protein